MSETPRNPTCTIPGCDCQNGPPIDRCAECDAALPHHRDTCSRYTSNRGYGVLVRSPLAGSPPTTPEPPMTGLIDEDWDGASPLVNVPGMVAEIRRLGAENAELRAAPAEPSPESGALLNAYAEQVETHARSNKFGTWPRIAEARAAVDRRLATLERDAARMRTALEFYAKQAHWRRPESVEHDGEWVHFGSPAEADGGDCARAALSPSGEPTTERRE